MDAAASAAPGTPQVIVFWVLAITILLGAAFTMTRKNPVTAVMSLVGTFFALAVLYTTMSAHFVAILQILVYAGAIMVLFIFVVMILNREEVTRIAWRSPALRFAGVGAVTYLAFVLLRQIGDAGAGGLPGMRGDLPDGFGTVASVGDMLFREFLFPFEAISLLLLVAIVGGVVVSRSHKQEEGAREAVERVLAIRRLGSPESVTSDSVGHGGHDTHGGHS